MEYGSLYSSVKYYHCPSKHLCTLVPANLWYLISTNFLHWHKNSLFGYYLEQICFILCKFIIMIKIFFAETAPSNGAIWDEFTDQHQHKSTIFNT